MNNDLRLWKLSYQNNVSRLQAHSEKASDTIYVAPIPRDGHLRFIFACAEMAQAKLHIADIRVSRDELVEAVEEAGWCLSRFMENLHPTLTAKEVLTFKQTVGL